LELPRLHGELVANLKQLAIGTAFQTSALTRFLFLRREAPPLAAVLETKRRLEHQKSPGKPTDDMSVNYSVIWGISKELSKRVSLKTDFIIDYPTYSRKLTDPKVLIKD
jgi:hypothetical protein